jgi:hypothetical protein
VYRELWTSGWLTQLGLLGLAVFMLAAGKPERSEPYLVGSLVIGVMRQLERARGPKA